MENSLLYFTQVDPSSGSEFYNYEEFYSVFLLALVDYDCKFTYIGDGEIYNNLVLKKPF